MINPADLIVYEDENYVVINKPFGIPSIHSSRNINFSAHEIISNYYNKKIFVVHRIDKDASGLLAFAKTSNAHKYLNYLFMNNLITKEYFAIVHGKFPNNILIINKKIKEYASGRMGISKEGKDAQTKAKLIKSFADYSLLNVEILSGRRHQIRVHLYSEGFPLVGDKLYGNMEKQSKYSRMMLHCHHLKFFGQDKNVIDINIGNEKIMEHFIKSFEKE